MKTSKRVTSNNLEMLLKAYKSSGGKVTKLESRKAAGYVQISGFKPYNGIISDNSGATMGCGCRWNSVPNSAFEEVTDENK